jgi:hypothetical protein
MNIVWRTLWQKSRKRLKTGWLITAGLVALYLGAVQPMNSMKGIATEKGTGLAAGSEWQPVSMWHQTRLSACCSKKWPGPFPAVSLRVKRVRLWTWLQWTRFPLLLHLQFVVRKIAKRSTRG